ncbi:unnamed protein product [Sympodiomycopsis kandeliae]
MDKYARIRSFDERSSPSSTPRTLSSASTSHPKRMSERARPPPAASATHNTHHAHMTARDTEPRPPPMQRATPPSGNRPSTSAQGHYSRDSYVNGPGKTSSPAPGGYYLPPPGYSSDQGFWQPWAPPEGAPPAPSSMMPPGQGRWEWDNTDGTWTWKHRVSAGGAGLIETGSLLNPALYPHLSHPNWSIPQAKAVLSTWSLLATLSAGTSATLLTHYETRDKVSRLAVGMTYASLVVNIWGAVMAALCIVASITFQVASPRKSPGLSHRMSDPDCDNPFLNSSKADELAANGGPYDNSQWSSRKRPSFTTPTMSRLKSWEQQKHLTPMLIEILDRMAVAVGWLVPSAALCELLGVLIYTYTLTSPVVAAIAVSIALALCIAVTGSAFFAGWRGSRLRSREGLQYGALEAALQARAYTAEGCNYGDFAQGSTQHHPASRRARPFKQSHLQEKEHRNGQASRSQEKGGVHCSSEDEYLMAVTSGAI